MLRKLIIRYKLFLRKFNQFTSFESELSKVNTSQCGFITKDGNEVTITNHTYSYFIKLDPKQSDKLNSSFLKEMESRAKEMEKELEGQIKHSLDKIYTKINEYNTNLTV